MSVKAARRKTKPRVLPRLSITEVGKIRRRLTGTLNGQASPFGYVCSDPWARVCVDEIERGTVQLRKKKQHLERDLFNAGVYPPGGAATAMVENSKMAWMPPDYTGTPLDQREDSLSFREGCKMPASPSAVAIERIRHAKSRPAKSRLHTAA